MPESVYSNSRKQHLSDEKLAVVEEAEKQHLTEIGPVSIADRTSQFPSILLIHMHVLLGSQSLEKSTEYKMFKLL